GRAREAEGEDGRRQGGQAEGPRARQGREEVIVATTGFSSATIAGSSPDPDEGLSTRLRDLALVDLDALTIGASVPGELIAAFADDVADALREARTRIAALRTALGGPEPLAVLD